MEAHVVLGNAGLTVESYGTGTKVRLPGRSALEPRVFNFGTRYADMYASMAGTKGDIEFFTENGVLQLCRRGAAVKTAPQRWQDTPSSVITKHDVVIAFEERIFDAVMEDLQIREATENFEPIHVICLDTKDNPTQAKIQGKTALELCWVLEKTIQSVGREEFENQVPIILDEWETKRNKTPIKILHTCVYL
jgi:RNA polymerase II subunit A C-terminal domain phosphatase SSU72